MQCVFVEGALCDIFLLLHLATHRFDECGPGAVDKESQDLLCIYARQGQSMLGNTVDACAFRLADHAHQVWSLEVPRVVDTQVRPVTVSNVLQVLDTQVRPVTASNVLQVRSNFHQRHRRSQPWCGCATLNQILVIQTESINSLAKDSTACRRPLQRPSHEWSRDSCNFS